MGNDFQHCTVIFNNYTLTGSILPPTQIWALAPFIFSCTDFPDARHPAHTFHISIFPNIPTPQHPHYIIPQPHIGSPVVQHTIYIIRPWLEPSWTPGSSMAV